MRPKALFAELKGLLDRPFARNMGWLGAAEGIVRVTRLVAAVVLARQLGPEGYGIAAIALTVHEIFFVVARSGLPQRIVQCSDEEVASVTRSVRRLNFSLAGFLFVAQSIVGLATVAIYGEPMLALLVACLATSHLFSAFGMVSTALLRREGNMRGIGIAQVATAGTENILIALLACVGAGPWAFVLPKLVVTPIWVVLVRRMRPWSPGAAEPADWRPIVAFARRVVGSDLLAAVRDHMDYLLVGSVLGLEALGIYYFAFNAGLGFSLSIVRSFSESLYPHLCEARGDLGQGALRSRISEAYRTLAYTAVPLIVLQCALAPLYVPLVFGAQWAHATPVLMLICLSALPRLCGVGGSLLLRAIDRPDVEFAWGVLFTVLLAGALAIGLTGGVIGVAWSVLLAHALFLPLFTLRALRFLPAHREATVR